MKRILSGMISGSVVLAFLWAWDSGIVPFEDIRYKNPMATFVFAIINLPVLILSAIPTIGYSKILTSMAFFLWWFVIGFFFCWIFQAIQSRKTRTKK